MKPLIGVMSCIRDKHLGCHDVIRRTWVAHMVPGIEYRIFVGQGEVSLAPDEVQLDIPDDYYHLPEKSQAMCRWTLENSHDFLFKADRDTFLSPKRLLASGFERFDYSGHFPMHPQEGYLPADGHDLSEYCDPRGVYPYCSGGCGYWRSTKAMEMVVAAPLDWKRLDNKGNPAEDLWMPNILLPQGVRGYHDPRYLFKGDRLQLYGYDGISVHLSKGTGAYEPSWMDRCCRLSLGAL
jgi:hypothetical protein